MAQEENRTTPDPSPGGEDQGTWEPYFNGHIMMVRNSATGEVRARSPESVARQEEREAAAEAIPNFVIQTGGETPGMPTIRRSTGGGFGDDWMRRWADPDDPSYNPGFDPSMLQDENGRGITFFAVNPLGGDRGVGETFVSSDGKWTMTTGSFPSASNPYGRHATLTGPNGQTYTDNYWGVVQNDGDVPGGGAIAMNLGQPISGDVAGYPSFYEPWGDGSGFAPGTAISTLVPQYGWDLKAIQGPNWQRGDIRGQMGGGGSLWRDQLTVPEGTPPPVYETAPPPQGGGGDQPGNFPGGQPGGQPSPGPAPGPTPNPWTPPSGGPNPWTGGTGSNAPYGGLPSHYQTGGSPGAPYQQPLYGGYGSSFGSYMQGFSGPDISRYLQSGNIDVSGYLPGGQGAPSSVWDFLNKTGAG